MTLRGISSFSSLEWLSIGSKCKQARRVDGQIHHPSLIHNSVRALRGWYGVSYGSEFIPERAYSNGMA
jgi:hypothetical protein